MQQLSPKKMVCVEGSMSMAAGQTGGRGLSNAPTFWAPRIEEVPEGGFTIYKKHHGTPYAVRWSNGNFAAWSQ